MNIQWENRSKWCEFVENLLECPVCLEISQSHIYQCYSGHNICKNCRFKIQICPTCKQYISDTRNYVAEALSVHFEDIMISLKYTTNKIKSCNQEKKRCVHTQTQEIFKTSVETQAGNTVFKNDKFTQTNKMSKNNVKIQRSKQIIQKKKKRILCYPEVAKQKHYPCHINCCTSSLSFGKMIEHLKSCHMDSFYMLQEKNGLCEQNFKLKYVPSKYNVAAFIKKMGLFIIHFIILSSGDLICLVFVVNNTSQSKQLTFELTIEIGEKAQTYSGVVNSF